MKQYYYLTKILESDFNAIFEKRNELKLQEKFLQDYKQNYTNGYH